jgi:hypothetical protein
MFRAALAKVSKFTAPVIVSRRTHAGACSSSIGTFVIVNKDGWIVTAGHILRQWHQLTLAKQQSAKLLKDRADIDADPQLSKKEKAIKLGSMVIGKDDTVNCSAWWGKDGRKLKQISYVSLMAPNFGEAADIGIGRLDPFDPNEIAEFPVFKKPDVNFDPGVSLCKLGFPFHSVTPVWDPQKNSFALPPGTLPMPQFPLEGMFTRIAEVQINGKGAPPFPIRYVETSTPGLKGQSGGPIFDKDGNVWAIQAKTIHLDLGFNASTKQFLNLGLGVHPTTIFPIFDKQGVKYQVTTD